MAKKYKESICFMVDTNTCLKEAVEPRTSWVMLKGNEVEVELLLAYVEDLL